MNKDYILNIDKVSKSYNTVKGKKQVLDEVSFKIKEGDCFALLGINGSGKSTMIGILNGLVSRDGGSINVAGYDPATDLRNVSMNIGFVPQEIIIDPFFTPRQVLYNYAGFYKIPKKERRINEVLELLSLEDNIDVPCRALSGGMKRRLLIAKAIIHRPPILMLDEPSVGLDINLREDLCNNIKMLNKMGSTILLTTHYLEEAEDICSSVAILNDKKVVRSGKIADMVKDLSTTRFTVTVSDTIGKNIFNDKNITIKDNCFIINIADNKLVTYLSDIESKGYNIVNIKKAEFSLEDVFRQHVV